MFFTVDGVKYSIMFRHFYIRKEYDYLRPCSHCGEAPVHGYFKKDTKYAELFYVYCTNCGCETARYKSITDAEKAWNKRATDRIRRGTQCVIWEHDEQAVLGGKEEEMMAKANAVKTSIAVGETKCSFQDQYIRERGRQLALHRAQKHLTGNNYAYRPGKVAAAAFKCYSERPRGNNKKKPVPGPPPPEPKYESTDKRTNTGNA